MKINKALIIGVVISISSVSFGSIGQELQFNGEGSCVFEFETEEEVKSKIAIFTDSLDIDSMKVCVVSRQTAARLILGSAPMEIIAQLSITEDGIVTQKIARIFEINGARERSQIVDLANWIHETPIRNALYGNPLVDSNCGRVSCEIVGNLPELRRHPLQMLESWVPTTPLCPKLDDCVTGGVPLPRK